MFFTRTQKYHFNVPSEELKSRLIGKHVRIHNLDFEVLDEDGSLNIIPHAEQVDAIKTLPITNVRLHDAGDKTKVVITSKMRQLDSGGPQLILIFCLFLLIAAAVLFVVAPGEAALAYTLLGSGGVIFALFAVRMQMGYFDYVRKVRGYVRSKAATTDADAIPLAA